MCTVGMAVPWLRACLPCCWDPGPRDRILGGYSELKLFYFSRSLPAPHLLFRGRTGLLVQEAEGRGARYS